MSDDIKKVDLEGDSKDPAEKEQLKEEDLEGVAGGAVDAFRPAGTTTDPPNPDLSGRFNTGGIAGKY